ncbi:MAG: ABC transporter ATP-binding protein [Candidatus Riflebacteria bacterium]|nr:ABC transporter ATP-binding protein [Candidatus Riflebacteria bacterium]
MEAISITNLTMKYDNQPVFSGLTTSIKKGSVTALLGRNGAGKTTLLKILSGQLNPKSGLISVLGLNPFKNLEELRQKCIMVTENCHLYRNMTKDNVADVFGPIYKSWNRDLFEEYVAKLNVPADKKISTFSRGMCRKLQLAFALGAQPEVLLLDEPVGGVDAIARDEILCSLIESLAEKGVTILLSSHELHDIAGICDHVIILDRGRFAVDGDREELNRSIVRVNSVLDNYIGFNLRDKSVLSSRLKGSEVELVVKGLSEDEIRNNLLKEYKPKNIEMSALSLEELFKAVVSNFAE